MPRARYVCHLLISNLVQ